MRNNPFSGPAHYAALANALERPRRPEAYVRPPQTGGEQISVRLGESLLTHLDVIGKSSGWTRVQVLTALIERGLFDLYELLSDETGEAIMESLAHEVVPTMHTDSDLTREVKRLLREILVDGCTITPGVRPESFWIEGPRTTAGIPRMLITVERYAADDFARAGSPQRRVMIDNLRPRLEDWWQASLSQPGKEQRRLITPEHLVPMPHN